MPKHPLKKGQVEEKPVYRGWYQHSDGTVAYGDKPGNDTIKELTAEEAKAILEGQSNV